MFGKDDIEPPLSSKKHYPTSSERALDGLVADWVGEEAAPEVHGKMHKRPKQIGDCVNKFLVRIHQDEEILLGEITNHWAELAGAETSLQMKPTGIRGKTLTVSAFNQTYMFVFRDPKVRNPILERLRNFTEGRIEDIRVVSAGRWR